jgi:uncharacterized protein
MSDTIRIKAGAIQVHAELNNTRTAKALLESLPVNTKVNTWGEEIYFDVPLHMEIEDGKQEVEMGDVAYWPDGPSLCLFFGQTPASRGNEIRAASPVSVVGRIAGDPTVLKSVRSGAEVTIEKVTSA